MRELSDSIGVFFKALCSVSQRLRVHFLPTLAGLWMGAATGFGSAPPPVRVDWQSFLARHDLLWDRPGTNWYEGLFLGNGLLGSMIYCETRAGDERQQLEGLRIDLGRADVYDRNTPTKDGAPSRVPIGRIVLIPKGEILSGPGRLDLYRAEAGGEMKTKRGSVRWRSLIPSRENVILVEAEAFGEEEVRFEFRWHNSGRTPVAVTHEGAITLHTVSLKDRTHVAIASRELRKSPRHRWLFTAIGNDAGKRWVSTGDPRIHLGSQDDALGSLKTAWQLGPERLIHEHRRWWHAYYNRSFVSIPETDTESYYWIQIYKLATALRPAGPLVDNLGPWSTETAETQYPFHTWDLNVQATYEVPFTINRVDFVKPLLMHLDRNILHSPQRQYDWLSIGQAGSFELPIHVLPERGTRASHFGGSAHLVWACLDFLNYYRYTMEDRFLRGGLYPLLRMSVNGMIRPERLVAGAGGRLELRYSRSPEYAPADEWMTRGIGLTNSNYELSLLRWGLETLLWLKQLLQVEEPAARRWKEVLDNLAEYPQDETGYRISSEFRLEEGHRHYSHLMMIYPLHLVDGRQPEFRQTVATSLDRWLSLPADRKARTGFTYTAASCMYSSLGQGDQAYRWIREFLAGTTRGKFPVVQPNTFYRELGPVFESPMLFLQSVSYMFLQSWRDRIQVFPAVPGCWKDLVFHNLRAQGAFLVSAERRNGATRWVRVESLAGSPCRIEPGMEGQSVRLTANHGISMKRVGEGVFELHLRKGEIALLHTGDPPRLPALPESHGSNHYRIRLPGLGGKD